MICVREHHTPRAGQTQGYEPLNNPWIGIPAQGINETNGGSTSDSADYSETGEERTESEICPMSKSKST